MKTLDQARLLRLLGARAKLEACAPPRPQRRSGPPVLYDFGAGRPDPESFPLTDLVTATAEALEKEGREALTYGAFPGYDGLRDLACAKFQKYEGAAVSRDEVLVTNGSSQALGIIADAFLDVGDVVVSEAPTFSGTLSIFRRHGVEVQGIPLDDSGMRVDALAACLERLASQGRRPKLIYTIDTFQNPAGPTLSLERRRELLRLADQHGTLVVEDDAYGELRFEGEPAPSLYALDGSGLSIRTGTLSKILGAGVRLGWIIAHPDVIQRLVPFKQDWGTNPFVSRVATYYLRNHLYEHVEELIAVYRRKRDVMLAGLQDGLGESAKWNRPEGGFFTWLRLPEGTDTVRLADLAAERQVSYASGPGFFPDGSGAEYVRLSYSYAALDAIAEGTGRLCEAINLARRMAPPHPRR